MPKNLYKVLKIDYNSIDSYGDIFAIYANKAFNVIEGLGMASFRNEECEDTEIFIYPQDESAIRPITLIAERGKAWEPDMSEFKDGKIFFSKGSKVAHYHNSLILIKNKAEMRYRPLDVSFDQVNWNKLGEGDNWGNEWEFSLAEIRTPYGHFDIYSFMEVQQNGQVGIQLDVYGPLLVRELPGYDGDEDVAYIQTIAVVRTPHNAWLWIHMFDEDNRYVACFSGTEVGLDNEFARYIAKLRNEGTPGD